VTSLANSKDYTDLTPPFRAGFASLMPIAVGIPPNPDYVIWANGFLQATEAVVLNPAMSVDAAIGKMKTYVTNQVGDDSVETRP
jgi:multiple sugar transport system substrate-binding protein